MNAAARVRREKVRMQAAAMFEESKLSTQIAVDLRVSPTSVREWRRRWVAGGTEALASSGPGGSDCKLTEEQLGELTDLLDRGPVEQGWQDARWTLTRVAEVIERRFGVSYTLRGVSYLLHRIGYSQQVPTRRAIERDPEAIVTWHRRRWPSVRG
jgi:putative transposase